MVIYVLFVHLVHHVSKIFNHIYIYIYIEYKNINISWGNSQKKVREMSSQLLVRRGIDI